MEVRSWTCDILGEYGNICIILARNVKERCMEIEE
jgi:hypothetical protein